MPDFLCVLTDGTVGGELACAGNVYQALAAKCAAISIVSICLQLGINIGLVVQQGVVGICLAPVVGIQQGVVQVTLICIGGNSAVDQGVDCALQVGIAVVDSAGIVAVLDLVDLLNSCAEARVRLVFFGRL